jgi:hypothetical protein
MGYSLSWIGVRGKSTAELRGALSLTGTGHFEEVPETPFSSASLEGGWELLVMKDCDHEFIAEETLRRLSADCEIVAASVEEHVMTRRAEGWKDGRRLWRLIHEAEKDIEHLEAGGVPPACFPEFKARAFELRRRDGDDSCDHVFDVPLNVAKALTGFKHDDGGPEHYETLERISRKVGGFWGRLFGSG